MLSQEESILSASCNPPNHAHAKPRPTGVAGASEAPLNMKYEM